MRIVLNKSNHITNKQIESCLELLHKDYLKIDADIYIYGTRDEIEEDEYGDIVDSDSRGHHIYLYSGKSKINIYEHGYGNRIENPELTGHLHTIASLYHEIRHAYQYRYMKKEYSRSKWRQRRTRLYRSLWHERDAEHFSDRMMLKNKIKINHVLGVNFNWDCERWGKIKISK